MNRQAKKEEPIGPNRTNGSPGGTRTPDKAVNSRLLYQLSYRGKLTRLYSLTWPESQDMRTLLSEIWGLKIAEKTH